MNNGLANKIKKIQNVNNQSPLPSETSAARGTSACVHLIFLRKLDHEAVF